MKRLQLCDVHLFVVMSPRLLLLTPFSHKQTKSCYKKSSIVSRDNSNHEDYELAWLREANLCGVIFSLLQELICAGCNIRKKKNPQNFMLHTVSFQPMTLLSTCYYSYHGKSSSPELVILDVRQYILILFQSVPILVLIFSLQSCQLFAERGYLCA